MLPLQVFQMPEGVIASKAAQHRERQFIQARAHLKGTLELLELEREDAETAHLIARETREQAEAAAAAAFAAGGGYASVAAEVINEVRACFALEEIEHAIRTVREVLASYTPQETGKYV